jgi:hypothetical protein
MHWALCSTMCYCTRQLSVSDGQFEVCHVTWYLCGSSRPFLATSA